MAPRDVENQKLKSSSKASYETVAQGPSEGSSDEASAYILMEFIGTFFLCITVATAATLSKLAPLAIGAVLMCFVYAGAHVSGSNFNPAVTLTLALTGNLPWPKAITYMITQLVAGVAAAVVGGIMLEGDDLVGHPAIGKDYNVISAAIGEVAFTFALCLVVLNTACSPTNTPNQFYGLAIGFTVTAGACAAGPVSGGAFNPAVGLGLPLLAGDAFPGLPIYFMGPFGGAILAAGVYSITEKGGDMAALLMEFVGTFFLCLTVAGAAALSPALAPVAIGGILMCMIYAGAHVSGANYNPAVSFALFLTQHLTAAKTATYILVQMVAGVAAAVVGAIMIEDANVGHPAIGKGYSVESAALAELLFTFALCFVVLNVACAEPNHGNQYYGLAIGFTVTAGACAVGSISGGAFNPAVGFGLPIVAGDALYPGVAIYCGATMAGGALAAAAYRLTNPAEFRHLK